MEFKWNTMYQMKSNNNDAGCVGCIMRCVSVNPPIGRVIYAPYEACYRKPCRILVDEIWVELSEEQAMEAMLGG